MKIKLCLIALLCAPIYAHSQRIWNIEDKAGYIGYLIEPRFMIDHTPVFPKKKGLSIVFYPKDYALHFLVDTTKRPDFLKYFSAVAADYITSDSIEAINNLYLVVDHPHYDAKYEFTARTVDRTSIDATDEEVIKERLNLLARILPFNCYIVARGMESANVDIDLDITEWIKTHRGFDFNEYSLILASVLYDYPLARAKRFSRIFLRYIDHDNISPDKRVQSFSFDFQGRKVTNQYKKHASYLSLKVKPKI